MSDSDIISMICVVVLRVTLHIRDIFMYIDIMSDIVSMRGILMSDVLIITSVLSLLVKPQTPNPKP